MTARVRNRTRAASNLRRAAAAAVLAAAAVACGPSYFEIPIETPIRPKMDVSPFQRVLVAGFVAGGSDDVEEVLERLIELARTERRDFLAYLLRMALIEARNQASEKTFLPH